VTSVELVPSLLRMLGACAVVIALLAATLWLLKRGTGRSRGGRGFAIEAALPLGERRSLAIVSIEGRRLLLGLAPNHVSLVTELSRAAAFDEAVSRATGESAPGPIA
jgi:flagellar biosynthetic protein FliO